MENKTDKSVDKTKPQLSNMEECKKKVKGGEDCFYSLIYRKIIPELKRTILSMKEEDDEHFC